MRLEKLQLVAGQQLQLSIISLIGIEFFFLWALVEIVFLLELQL